MRRTIYRKLEEFRSRVFEVIEPSEQCGFYFEQGGLKVRIGIQSVRAMERFEQLQKLMFQSFVPHNFVTDEHGITWASFGYSEPL
ncbi:MAG: hypothetical protein ACRD5K_15560 [Candidatus Acidiferrales bacterium]